MTDSFATKLPQIIVFLLNSAKKVDQLIKIESLPENLSYQRIDLIEVRSTAADPSYQDTRKGFQNLVSWAYWLVGSLAYSERERAFRQARSLCLWVCGSNCFWVFLKNVKNHKKTLLIFLCRKLFKHCFNNRRKIVPNPIKIAPKTSQLCEQIHEQLIKNCKYVSLPGGPGATITSREVQLIRLGIPLSLI